MPVYVFLDYHKGCSCISRATGAPKFAPNWATMLKVVEVAGIAAAVVP
jgi:hypothetical protein